MKELLKRYLIQILKDYAQKALTEENLKLALEWVVRKCEEKIVETDNVIDDWVLSVVSGWLTDENIHKLYEYLKPYCDYVVGTDGNVYGMSGGYYALAESLAPDGKTYATPTLGQIVQLLQIIIPLLIEWARKGE